MLSGAHVFIWNKKDLICWTMSELKKHKIMIACSVFENELQACLPAEGRPEIVWLEILREKVFPFISLGEIVKIDFNVKVSYDTFQVTME